MRDHRPPARSNSSLWSIFALGIVAAFMTQWLFAGDEISTEPSSTPTEEYSSGQAAQQEAKPVDDLRTLFSGDDYPSVAQSNNEEGTVQAKLSIDKSGRVASCTIVRSSEHSSLDDATCRILTQRARFMPATDAARKPIMDVVTTPPIRWQLID